MQSFGFLSFDPLVTAAIRTRLRLVDQIRDILFGGQMRDYDRRLERLEERLQQERSELTREIEHRAGMLEKLVKRELEKLTEKWCSERQDRSNALTEYGRRLGALEQELGERIDKLDDAGSRDFAEVRQQIHDLGRDLKDRLRDQQDQLARSIEKEAAELQADKVSRDNLADLFTEVALRLQGSFELPQDSQR